MQKKKKRKTYSTSTQNWKDSKFSLPTTYPYPWTPKTLSIWIKHGWIEDFFLQILWVTLKNRKCVTTHINMQKWVLINMSNTHGKKNAEIGDV